MGTAAALTLLVPTLLLVVTVTAAVTVAGDAAAVTEPSSIGPALVARRLAGASECRGPRSWLPAACGGAKVVY